MSQSTSKRARRPATAPRQLIWLPAPEAHDFPAAASYLSLLFTPKRVERLIGNLRKSKLREFKAKDIFRASQLSLLGISNSHVEKDRTRIEQGHALSPLLLVRSGETGTVIVADGYHRLCAVYSYDEDALIPCKIA